MRKSDLAALVAFVSATALAISLLATWWQRSAYEEMLVYYFGELHEQTDASQRQSYTHRLAAEISRRGDTEVRRAFDLVLGPRSWRYQEDEFEHELLFAIGRLAAQEALRRLENSQSKADSFTDEEWLSLRVLATVTNRPVIVPGNRTYLSDGTLHWIVEPAEKTRLIRSWRDWWEHHGHKDEAEWFIGQLVDADIAVRTEAIRRLRNIYGTDLGYSHDAEQRELEEKHAEWLKRWKSLARAGAGG